MKTNDLFYETHLKNLDCECKEPQTCGEIAQRQFQDYLCREECKPEVEQDSDYGLSKYDPNEVYFLQYRSARTLTNQQFGRKIIDIPDNTIE